MAKKIIIETEINTQGAEDSVNDLSSSIDSLGGNVGSTFGKLGDGFKSLQTGLGAAKLGFHGLKGAIAATGIGLLVIALAGLISYFTQTQEGIELVERGMNALSTAVNVIIDRFASFGKAILSFDLGGMADSFRGVTDEIVEEVIAVDKLTVAMQGLAYEQSQFIVGSARLTAEFEKQKKKSDDVTLSFEERVEATNKMAEAQKELLEESQRLLKEETIALLQGGEGAETRAKAEQLYNDVLKEGKVLKLENLGFSNSTIEDLNKTNSLIAEAIKLEGEFAAKTTESQNKLNSLSKEQEKIAEERRDRVKVRKAEQEQEERERLIAEQEAADKKIEDRLKEMEEERKQDAEDEERRKKNMEARLTGAKEIDDVEVFYEGKRNERTNQEIKNDAILADAKVQSALGAADGIISIGNSLVELGIKNEKFQKGLVVAQIAVDTAKGVSAAVAAGAGLPFPANIPAIISGVAAVLGGMVQAKAALSKAKGTSSAPQVALPSVGSVSGGISSSQGGSPLPNDQTVFAQQQLFGTSAEQVGGEAGQNQVRAYVSERDITDTQNRINTFEERAELG